LARKWVMNAAILEGYMQTFNLIGVICLSLLTTMTGYSPDGDEPRFRFITVERFFSSTLRVGER
jgi:hypothetical protein